MGSIFLLAKRDVKNYFSSPTAYIILAVFILLVGWMFLNLLSMFQMQSSQFASINIGQKPNLSESVIRPLFGNMNVLLLFIAPFITMRLVAEEKKDHTIELLLTAPIRSWQIVLGKFLAGLLFLFILLSASFIFPILLFFISSPDWGVIFSCYLGIFFVSSTYVAFGLFWSSRTENQIVAAILTFGTLLFFWLISWAAHRAGPIWGEVLTYLSVIGHYTNFAQGIIDSSDIIYYLSCLFLGLFFTHLSFDTNHWSS